MNQEIKEKILAKIKEYDSIVLFRHRRPDGDCMGASRGLQEILRQSFPEKTVLLPESDTSDYLEFLGPDDPAVDDETYARSLAIIVDTSNLERVSNQKFSLCREIVKIDHHIDNTPYGDISWVEDHRSSACEMIVDFYNTFKDQLQINQKAAGYLYTGMVTDSGRFRYSEVTGETLRLAGLLLDVGVDTQKLYMNLYLDDFSHYKFLAHVYEIMERTENGVAWLYISREMQKEYGLTFESAAANVSAMDGIKGSICWLAFIENPSADEIRVRLRSRFMAVNTLAEQYNGGGHACASGSTVHTMEEVHEMVAKADAMVKAYKEEHQDIL